MKKIGGLLSAIMIYHTLEDFSKFDPPFKCTVLSVLNMNLITSYAMIYVKSSLS